jgi:trimethylamine monooxygenase
MFDAQAWWVRDVVVGRIRLPGQSAMRTFAQAEAEAEEGLCGSAQKIALQTAYVRGLTGCTNAPRLDLDLVERHFNEWERHKEESIVGYRDRAFASAVDGTVACAPKTSWARQQDHTLAAFLADDGGAGAVADGAGGAGRGGMWGQEQK